MGNSIWISQGERDFLTRFVSFRLRFQFPKRISCFSLLWSSNMRNSKVVFWDDCTPFKFVVNFDLCSHLLILMELMRICRNSTFCSLDTFEQYFAHKHVSLLETLKHSPKTTVNNVVLSTLDTDCLVRRDVPCCTSVYSNSTARLSSEGCTEELVYPTAQGTTGSGWDETK